MQSGKFPAMLVAGLAVVVFGTAGCGGSSSTPIHPATTLITVQNGDQWQYNITGTATPTGGGQALPITGTAIINTGSTTVNAQPALVFSIASNVSVNGAAAVQIVQDIYFTQDVNGNLIEVQQSLQDSSGVKTKTVTTPSLANSEIFPGTFSNGETVAETIDFTDTTSEAYKLVVGAPAQETTPAGVFNTWPTTITIGGAAQGTEFWDPAIGMFVQGTINTGNVDVSGTNYNLSISYALTKVTLAP